jgi:hypothetical protein
MPENKTKARNASVEAFLDRVPSAARREDAYTLVKMLKGITRQPPKMWGPSIVGFGSYHYKYATGREGDMPMAGFSPGAASMTVYIMRGNARFDDLIAQLGKCKTSVSCLYINKLADVDLAVLRELMATSYQHLKTHGLHGEVTRPASKPQAPSKPRTGASTKARAKR